MKNFYSEKGITATSANHICNIAKEHYETIEQELTNLSFYNTEIELLTAGKKVLTSKGNTDLSDIKSKIQEIADCKTLIAYLREAIKDKEKLTSEITLPDDLVLPERPDILKTPTQEDIKATWSTEKLLRYYRLQTIAATYGEQVHPTGAISTARDSFHKILSKPNSVALQGTDTIISTYTPSVDKNSVETLYFDLQAEQRKAQAEYNGLVKEIDDAISEIDEKNQQEYIKLLDEYRTARNKYDSEREIYINKKKQEIKNLKICIPENLKKIYDKINSLSQK